VRHAAGRDRDFIFARKTQEGGDRFRRAGQGDGIRFVRGKLFVARIFCQRGGFENDFAGQKPFKLAQQTWILKRHYRSWYLPETREKQSAFRSGAREWVHLDIILI